MRTRIPRWLLLALAGIAVLLGAVWATTPPVVPTPEATVWARCFESITLPPSNGETQLALVRRDHLDGSTGNDRDEATLLAATAEPILITLNPKEQESFADDHPAELPAGEVIQEAALGAGKMRLVGGRLELRQTDGGRYLVEAPARFALDPAEAYTARLTQPTRVEKTDEEGLVRLPKGSELKIELPADKPVFVEQAERLSVRPLVLPPTASTFAPDIRPAREAEPHLVARLTAPGLTFDPAELRACLWLGNEATPRRVPITGVDAPTPGLAEIVLDLPSEPFPWLDWRRGRSASLVVVTTDGTYAGTGQFVYPSGFWAFLLATGLALLLFVGLVWLRNAGKEWKTWIMGLFLGEDGQPSLSLFQILLWTIVTVWALLFVFFSTGNLLTMTPQVMTLLGLAGAGSLAARWVAASRQPTSPSTPSTNGDGKRRPQFWALLENAGRLNLFKLQLFLFTVLIAGYVIFRVVRQSAFPALDTEFLLLMGVSNGLYVGSKLAQPSPFASAEARKLEWDVLRLRVEDLEKEMARLEAESKDLDANIAQETDPARKQNLTDQKSIRDKRIMDLRAELAQARGDRDAKEKEYKEALALLAKA